VEDASASRQGTQVAGAPDRAGMPRDSGGSAEGDVSKPDRLGDIFAMMPKIENQPESQHRDAAHDRPGHRLYDKYVDRPGRLKTSASGDDCRDLCLQQPSACRAGDEAHQAMPDQAKAVLVNCSGRNMRSEQTARDLDR
jgi:hypothetical protein